MKWTLFFFCFFVESCSAREYIYPVAYSDQHDLNFFIYQKSLDCLELWASSPTGNQAPAKMLSNFFIPAGFKLLPDQDGFSFICHDAIYIKYFARRSPKRIEFYEPFYGINTIEWINAETFYFYAKEHQHYKIYQADISGEVHTIIGDEFFDALYPQKVGAQLFYIERDDRECRLMRTAYYAPENKQMLCVLSVRGSFDTILRNAKSLRTSGKVPAEQTIAFLHMVSDKEGFFLEYPTTFKQKQKTITFWYYRVHSDEHDRWHYHRLFSLELPVRMFIGDERLYESIAPFVQNFSNNYS